MAQLPSQNRNDSKSSDGHSLKDIPSRQRPREELARLGVDHVSDHVLLAVLLRSGVRGVNVVELAHTLLGRYRTLTGLAATSLDELASIKGMGKVKAQVLSAALQLAKRMNEERVSVGYSVKTPSDVAALLRADVRVLDEEVFWVLLLDTKNRLKLPPLQITRGLLDASLVHAREVFREAIRAATAAVVLAHNHPSGDVTPSAEDIRITNQLVKAGSIIDIKVLDHVIIGRPMNNDAADFMSLSESGLVDFG